MNIAYIVFHIWLNIKYVLDITSVICIMYIYERNVSHSSQPLCFFSTSLILLNLSVSSQPLSIWDGCQRQKCNVMSTCKKSDFEEEMVKTHLYEKKQDIEIV